MPEAAAKKKVIVVPRPAKATPPERDQRNWPVDDLCPHPRQAEFFSGLTQPQLHELMRAIERDGLEQPLEITASGVVISGHQRLRAVRLLGWSEVPVIVRHDLITDDQILQRLVESNCHRQHLSKLQLARICKLLHDAEPKAEKRRGEGQLNERIGKLYGLSGKTVERMLALLECPTVTSCIHTIFATGVGSTAKFQIMQPAVRKSGS